MAHRNPGRGNDGHAPSRDVAEALQMLAANPEAVRAAGILDPWRIDDILENQVVPELQAIRTLLEIGQRPLPVDGEVPGDEVPGRTIVGLLEDIRRNTSAVVAPEFNIDDLPVGTVGETTEALTEGKQGEALFDIEGSTFIAEVTATAELSAFDPIQVFRPDNVVRPIPQDEQQPERRTAPRYVTTGPDPIDVTNTSFETFDIVDADGNTLVTDTVVLFFDEAVDVSFTTDDEEQVIPLTAEKSPATFSSVGGIRATRVLYRQNADAAGPAELTIIALK